jgi:hypothetical protein
MKEHAGAEFVGFSVFYCRSGTAREYQPHMLDVAAQCPEPRSNVNGPLPSRFVRGATDGHTSDVNELELSFFERSYLVRLLKRFRTVSSIGIPHLRSGYPRCATSQIEGFPEVPHLLN